MGFRFSQPNRSKGMGAFFEAGPPSQALLVIESRPPFLQVFLTSLSLFGMIGTNEGVDAFIPLFSHSSCCF